jgi:TonB family protein
MTHEVPRRTQLIALIAAFLIHLLLFTPFILKQTAHITIPAATPQESAENFDEKGIFQLLDEHDWIELKAGASEHTTPISEDEIPSCGFQHTSEQIAPPAAHETSPSDAMQPAQPSAATAQSTSPEHSVQEHVTHTDTTEQSKDDESTDVLLDEHNAPSPVHTVSAPQPQPMKVPKKESRALSAQPTSTPAIPSRTISLADITKGYLNQLRNDGNSTLAMAGHANTGSLPPDSQIMYQRFMEKFHWQLQNAFKINKHRLRIRSGKVDGMLKILVTLNENGSLKDLQLVQSSGSYDIDQFMLLVMKDASKSFPPFPKKLNPVLRSFVMSIHVYIPAGVSDCSGLTFSLA